MITTKNCGCAQNVGCGCGDNVYTTNNTCNSIECETPEKCPETFSSDCLLFMGDTIANLEIKKGTPMTTVLDQILLAIINPNCAYPTSPCRAVFGLLSSKITSTTIKLGWEALDPVPTSYEVEYREVTSGTWLQNGAITTNTNTIGGLTPNTDYVVRVKTTCGSNTCYSLVKTITTKP